MLLSQPKMSGAIQRDKRIRSKRPSAFLSQLPIVVRVVVAVDIAVGWTKNDTHSDSKPLVTVKRGTVIPSARSARTSSWHRQLNSRRKSSSKPLRRVREEIRKQNRKRRPNQKTESESGQPKSGKRTHKIRKQTDNIRKHRIRKQGGGKSENKTTKGKKINYKGVTR